MRRASSEPRPPRSSQELELDPPFPRTLPTWPVVLRGAALAALALLVFVPAVRCGFVWDDDTFLTDNPLIAASDGLVRFWLSTEPPDYFPLTSTTLWLEWRLWGNDPAGYHAVNVLLHAASSVLLWRVLARLALPGAWLAAALFAVHPVNVESVAWITQRKSTLPLVFYLVALLAYLRFEDTGPPSRRRWYAGALAAFVLALLAKTSVVVLPPVLLLCAWWRRDRVTATDLERTAPFFAASALLGLVTVWYQTHSAIGDEIVRDDGFVSRLAIAGRAVWFYLWKALLPLELCFVYPRWETGVRGLATFVPLALLAACFAALWRFRRGWSRPFLFAATYFVLALLPVLGFVDIYFMRYSLVADHYQYLALIGVAALAAAGMSRLSSALREPIAVLVLALLATLTWQRQAAYRDLDALWTDTLAVNPSAWMAHNNLGLDRHRHGRLEEAVTHFERALRVNPDLAGVRYNLGTTLQLLRRFDEAAAHYEAALRLDPDYAEAHDNLGNALQAMGRFEEAIAHGEAALRLEPDFAEAYNNLGNALYGFGRFEEALARYEQALRLEPDYAQASSNLGSALHQLGRFGEAVAKHEQALRLDPELAGVRHNLGNSLMELGRFEEAIAQFEQRLALAPSDVAARQGLANAFERSGRFAEAATHYSLALRSQPDDVYLLNDVAWLLATCPDSSVRDGRRALELAERVVEMAGDGHAVPIATLAAAHGASGDFDEAVRLQERAVELASSAQKDAYRERLDLYRRGLLLPRRAWWAASPLGIFDASARAPSDGSRTLPTDDESQGHADAPND